MNAYLELLEAYPQLDLLWQQFCTIVSLSVLLAFAGLGIISVTARMLAISRRRSSFDKCARQLAMLSMGLGWLLLIASRVWLYLSPKDIPANSLQAFLLEGSWMLLSIAVLVSSIYFLTWKPLKNMPALHVTLGLISSIQGLVTLLVSLGTARLLTAAALPEAGQLALRDLFLPGLNSVYWSAAVYTLPLMFGMAGAFAAVWLPLRRRHEDYGRDHYNTMIPWCAAWARNAWCLLWLLVLAFTALNIWQQWGTGSFSQMQALIESGWLLLWLLPAILWCIVCRSSIALRHKFTLLLALLVAMGFCLPYFEAATSLPQLNPLLVP